MPLFILFPFLLFAPALQGLWDLRTQFLLEAAVLLSGGLWIFREARSGRLPAFFAARENIPLLCALALTLFSSLSSPFAGRIAPEWWNFATGVAVLALASSLTSAERKSSDLALRLSVWFIVLLGFYQGYLIASGSAGGSARLAATLTNENALALLAVMMIPMAVLWRDFVLLAALVVVLIWTMSVAAVFGLLAGASLYAADNLSLSDLKKNGWVFAVLLAAAVGAFSQLDAASVSDRLRWWGSAFRMFAERPFLGFGYGGFTYAYPAFHQHEAGGISSIYAHNYYLEFMAENGLPAFLFWAWAVFARLKRIRGMKKYALTAGLAHSFADFGLAVPAIFFVFCYLLAEPAGEPRPVAAPSRPQALAAAALVLLAAAHLSGAVSRKTEIDLLAADAVKAAGSGDYRAAAGFAREAAMKEPGDPRAPQLLGRILWSGAKKNDRPALFRAAVSFERAITLDPYCAPAYWDLGRLYASAGERKMREGLLKRKGEVFR